MPLHMAVEREKVSGALCVESLTTDFFCPCGLTERKHNFAKTAPVPGVTRSMSGFKVSEDPLAFLIDTPGIMLPKVDNIEVGLKLALTGRHCLLLLLFDGNCHSPHVKVP